MSYDGKYCAFMSASILSVTFLGNYVFFQCPLIIGHRKNTMSGFTTRFIKMFMLVHSMTGSRDLHVFEFSEYDTACQGDDSKCQVVKNVHISIV